MSNDLTGGLPWWAALLLFYLLSSSLCFAAYAMDKASARKGARRTPEKRLLLMGLLCGWPGGLLAQQWLRHKSSKASFQIKFWVTVAINATVVYFCVPLLF